MMTKIFLTSDRDLAAWLLAKGCALTGVASDGRLLNFLFEETDVLTGLRMEFERDGFIPVQTYIRSQRDVRALIFSNRSAKEEALT